MKLILRRKPKNKLKTNMKTKFLTLITCVVGFFGLQSASAHMNMSAMDGWYLGASGSGSWHRDTNLGKDKACVSHDFGFGFNAAIGYILCDWSMRVEGEFLWHRWGNDKFKPETGDTVKDSGHIRRYAFMGNLIYDMELNDPVSLYVGGGVGYGNTRLELDHKIGANAYRSTKNDWTFAWQIKAGLIYSINECWDLTAGYRFFAMSKPELPVSSAVTTADATIKKAKVDDMPYSNHIDLGLRFKF